MSTAADFDPATEVLIEDRRARRFARLAGREAWASLAIGGAFLAVAVPFAFLFDDGRVANPLLLVALVGAYALSYKVEFEIGPGRKGDEAQNVRVV